MSTQQPITINKHILEMEYAVRGPIPQRAAELALAGKKTIPCNIGNPQALGQKPIHYYREIISLVENPILIEQATNCFASDTLAKAKTYLENNKSGTGAYTESSGPRFIREAIAKFIDQRDAKRVKITPANPDHIFITNGASDGVKFVLDLLISNPTDGIMIPIPQYPLYSATICKAAGRQVNYYPIEEDGWSINRQVLEESYNQAQQAGTEIKAIVVINPGNPTGAIMDQETIDEVINFAQEKNISIIADEVYQENTYGEEFISFASALQNRPVTLFSLHSVSKGFYGECGHRGGYLEIRNPAPLADTQLSLIDIIQKQASVSLCSNTIGQLMVWLLATPPTSQDASYEQFHIERQAILDGLYRKATMIKEAFTQMEGMQCYGKTGAMYLFPQMTKMPAGKTDFDYCMELLEETGLTTVNGSGFGQKAGTSHLRIAFLPPEDMLKEMLPAWIKFHNKFVNS